VSKLSKVRLSRLFQLARQLLALEPHGAEGTASLEPLVGVFGITAICLIDRITAGSYMIGAPSSYLEDQTRAAYITGQDLEDPAAQITIRRLLVGGRTIGAIGFQGLEDPHLTAGPLTSLVSALHERTRLRRMAIEAAVAIEIEAFRAAIFGVLGNESKSALTTILTAAGGLREAGPLRDDQLEMARIVEEEASRLGSVISRVERVARLDQEGDNPRMTATDLTTLVAQTCERFLQISPGRKIVLPSNGAVFKALADAELLCLAVSQLMNNACKYSDPNSAVQVELEERGGSVVVSVSSATPLSFRDDTRLGEGSAIGSRPLSFVDGAGLGLYVARKIAVAHGGTLEFDAERMETESVAFRLTLPRANGQPPEP